MFRRLLATMSQYKVIKVIGSGAFGRAVLVEHEGMRYVKKEITSPLTKANQV